jgi:acetyltransferase-like isoleucine patch superfamily enzyme
MAVISLVFSGTLSGRKTNLALQRFEPFCACPGAPRTLAVDGNQIVPIGPKRRNPVVETASEHDRVDAVDQCPQPAHARDIEMKRRESSQEIQMMLAPGADVVEIIARGDRGAGQKHEDVGGGIHDPPGFPVIVDLRKYFRKTTKRARDISPSKIASMITPEPPGPGNHEPPVGRPPRPLTWLPSRGPGSPLPFNSFHSIGDDDLTLVARGLLMAVPVATKVRNALHQIVMVLRRQYLIRVWQMDIGEGSYISLSAKLDKSNPRGIHIGKYTSITFGAAILTHDYINNRHSDVYIGDNCLIGAQSIVLPGVTIGDNCIVSPLSVVARNVPAGSLVIGNPARVVESNLKTGQYGMRLCHLEGTVRSSI